MEIEYHIAGYFRGIYISRISRKHSSSMKIKILKIKRGGVVIKKGASFWCIVEKVLQEDSVLPNPLSPFVKLVFVNKN